MTVNSTSFPRRSSHGTGVVEPRSFARFGVGIVIESGVMVFHPENIEIGDHVYVGHQTILKGYYKNRLIVGDGAWIGQQCFLHSAGGIEIGERVGIGPGVKILTSAHVEAGRHVPILNSPIEFKQVIIEEDSDLGVGAVVLPGIRIGRGVQVGAGAVVTSDVPPYAVVAGVPARVLGFRPEGEIGA